MTQLRALLVALQNLVVGISALLGHDTQESRRIDRLVLDSQEILDGLEEILGEAKAHPAERAEGDFVIQGAKPHEESAEYASAMASATFARRLTPHSYRNPSALFLPVASLNPKANSARCHDIDTYGRVSFGKVNGRCEICSRVMEAEFPEYGPISVYGHRESDHVHAVPKDFTRANPWIEASRAAMLAIEQLRDNGQLDLRYYPGPKGPEAEEE